MPDVFTVFFNKDDDDDDEVVGVGGGSGRSLPYKRLMGMCRRMGLHFHD